MKVLAIAANNRTSALPGVPTFKEQGFQGFDVESWIGVFAAAQTPEPVVQAWVAALREATAMLDVQARLTGYGDPKAPAVKFSAGNWMEDEEQPPGPSR